VMCSLFLKGQGEHPPGRLSRLAERGFVAVLRGYERGLIFIFRHQLGALMATLGLMGLTFILYFGVPYTGYSGIPKGFFPQQDTGFIFGQAEARQDTSFAKMAGIVHQIVDIVQKDPAVNGAFYFAGAYAYNPTENTGRVFIQLKPHDQRDVTSDQVIQRLRPKVAAVEGAKFFMQSGQDISIGGGPTPPPRPNSTRIFRIRRLAATCIRKAHFRELASSRLNSTSGSRRASGIAGNPPPLPMSTTPWMPSQETASRCSDSSMCASTASIVRAPVRLTRRFHSSSSRAYSSTGSDTYLQ